MQWEFNNREPVYQQIISHIRDAVLSGEFTPGSRIPPVRELAAEARVNPNTMQRALAELEREGLLVSGGSTGRFVTDDRTVLSRLHAEAVARLAESCVREFAALGLTAEEAAAALLTRKEEV